MPLYFFPPPQKGYKGIGGETSRWGTAKERVMRRHKSSPNYLSNEHKSLQPVFIYRGGGGCLFLL